MITKRQLFVRNAVAVLATTPLLWIAPSVYAQSSSPSSQESRISPNSDLTRQELARFDQFLDSHQEIAQQLRHDPSLVNDQNYVQGHPDLQTFLQDHPGVREEIKENPSYFMRQENRYERREDAREENNRREELARFDQFLDSHREISEQLRRDPSLVKNQQFVESHPALQSPRNCRTASSRSISCEESAIPAKPSSAANLSAAAPGYPATTGSKSECLHAAGKPL